VRWSFRHTPPAAPGTRPGRTDEPELPLVPREGGQ
jgi:hypothetical protein